MRALVQRSAEPGEFHLSVVVAILRPSKEKSRWECEFSVSSQVWVACTEKV